MHQFSKSIHAKKGVNCYNCHLPLKGQPSFEHYGFSLSKEISSQNCAQCHATEYEQFNRSRHGMPAWAAVRGNQDFTPEQIAHGEKYHKGAVKRPANKLAELEGQAAIVKGCVACHGIGKPHSDGFIG